MSNDPNRAVERNRHIQENRSHNTMETVKLEKQGASLPGWQQMIIYALAVVGFIAIIAVVASAIL